MPFKLLFDLALILPGLLAHTHDFHATSALFQSRTYAIRPFRGRRRDLHALLLHNHHMILLASFHILLIHALLSRSCRLRCRHIYRCTITLRSKGRHITIITCKISVLNALSHSLSISRVPNFLNLLQDWLRDILRHSLAKRW